MADILNIAPRSIPLAPPNHDDSTPLQKVLDHVAVPAGWLFGQYWMKKCDLLGPSVGPIGLDQKFRRVQWGTLMFIGGGPIALGLLTRLSASLRNPEESFAMGLGGDIAALASLGCLHNFKWSAALQALALGLHAYETQQTLHNQPEKI